MVVGVRISLESTALLSPTVWNSAFRVEEARSRPLALRRLPQAVICAGVLTAAPRSTSWVVDALRRVIQSFDPGRPPWIASCPIAYETPTLSVTLVKPDTNAVGIHEIQARSQSPPWHSNVITRECGFG